jgi:Cof subfamily protein (haloacid dehalogenase superfamily)
VIKLVLTDLDDTLICHGLPRATDHAIEGVRAMIAEGLHFGPVSGRIPNDMGWMFDNHGECYATGAYCNGQMIYVDGELVREEQIAADELNRLAEWLTRTDRGILTMFDVHRGDIHTAGYFVTPDDAHAERMLGSFGAAKRYIHKLDGTAYTKANIHVTGDRAYQTETRDLLREEFAAMDFVFPSTTAPLIDVSPHGWSKGSAVAALAEALGITLDEVATFGDSENDLSMIEAVPNSVAVANASDQIKQVARWHIGDSADDAVADALFDIAAAAKSGSMPSFMQA